MKVELSVIPDRGLCLNGVWFSRAGLPSDYVSALGLPSRVDEGEPRAPVGHRNNHRHVYDGLGICLLDHHATRLVEAVEVWYDPTFLPRGPATGFRGVASIGGLEIAPLMTTSDLAARSLVNKGLGQFGGEGSVCTSAMLTKRAGGTRHTERERWTIRGFVVMFVDHGRPATTPH